MKNNIDGLSIHSEKSGKGNVVLLLHGWGTSGENMHELAVSLQDSYMVITVDLPGFGESDQPKTDWHIVDYAHFVASLLASYKVTSPYAVIGHSFGGRVAIKAISEEIIYPERLVLIGSAGIKPPRTLRLYIFLIIAKLGKMVLLLPGLQRFADAARGRLYNAAGAHDYETADTMRGIFSNTISEDLSEEAASITTPTLLVWGANDAETPLKDTRYFSQVMQNSKLKILQNAGHFVHNEHPRKVAQWVKDFLG